MEQPAWSDSEGGEDMMDMDKKELSDQFSRRLSLDDSESDAEDILDSASEDIEKNMDGEDDSSDYSDFDEDGNDKTPGGRYFGVGGPNKGIKCFNCGKNGHMSKDCSEASSLPCYLCGGTDHQRSSCPEEICYNCQKVGHMSRDCPLPRKRRMSSHDICNKCGYGGHMQSDCSLAWRRYVFARGDHLSEGDVQRAEEMLSPHCYNCSSTSHFGDECSNRRRPEYSIFHFPSFEFLRVTAYHPNDRQPRHGHGGPAADTRIRAKERPAERMDRNEIKRSSSQGQGYAQAQPHTNPYAHSHTNPYAHNNGNPYAHQGQRQVYDEEEFYCRRSSNPKYPNASERTVSYRESRDEYMPEPYNRQYRSENSYSSRFDQQSSSNNNNTRSTSHSRGNSNYRGGGSSRGGSTYRGGYRDRG